ncbi:hypothetical protein BS47DRAFT_1364033 [Hydnum rufescens UP504]|uniref:Uncharacterized protein n=1 Tax=Hydnum rufescens UP504 TaxID=1448309 RepID=A0A9P6ASN8_9AGAM|nr:hypothetical protein BS47DRAFT_1364033 [Hydnum rufescens UP504]
MANHSAMTWDKDQRLVKAEYGMNSSAYPSSQDFTRLSTQHHQESPKAPGVQVLYLQIAWALVYTNSMHDFIFLGHPDCSATTSPNVTSMSLYDNEPSGLQESWAAYSWKDTSIPFNPCDISSLQVTLQSDYGDISLAQQAIHNILHYSYEVAACCTLYFHWTLHKVLGKCQFIYGIDDSMVGTVLEHPFLQTPWVQELMADGIPIFCIKDDVWRWLDSLPNGYQLGNHEIKEKNVLKSFQGLAHVLTVQVHVAANTQHPLDWMIMPRCDKSEPPIEDVVFWIINDGMDDHINLLQNLEQVFGNHIMDNVPETGSLMANHISNSYPIPSLLPMTIQREHHHLLNTH